MFLFAFLFKNMKKSLAVMKRAEKAGVSLKRKLVKVIGCISDGNSKYSENECKGLSNILFSFDINIMVYCLMSHCTYNFILNWMAISVLRPSKDATVQNTEISRKK